MRKLFPGFLDGAPAVGLLFLRLFAGVALMMHGWGKIQKPTGWMGPDSTVPSFLQALAALGEFGGGLGLILGLLTPIAALGVMCVMFVAAYSHILRGDAFVGGWELAGLYFVVSLMLVLTGPGVLSLDSALFGRAARVPNNRLPASETQTT
jgi:putative oxidoreductase